LVVNTTPLQTTSAAELADYRWLLSEEGQARLRQIEGDSRDDLRLAAELRRSLSAMRTRLLLLQRKLRQRAACKFPEMASHMFFTPKLLEQASGAELAAWKAVRFAGRAPVADLCCGLGGDLLGLAGLGDVLGVDCDPLACLLAEANVRVWREASRLRGTVCVIEGRVSPDHVRDVAGWHLDPDRRAAGGRSTRIELGSPPPQVIEGLLAVNPAGAVKLAPSASVPLRWEEQAELEWISSGGECRQLVVWFGPLAQQAGQRRATMLGASGASFAAAATAGGLPAPELAGRIRRYICEPEPCVLAAQLAGALAREYGLEPLDRQGGYLTGDAVPESGLLRTYEVLEWLPLDLRRLKAVLRARRLGRIVVKKRGVDHDPARLQRQLAVGGEESAVVILLRLRGRPMAVVCRRMKG
jgi:hypothetical protein